MEVAGLGGAPLYLFDLQEDVWVDEVLGDPLGVLLALVRKLLNFPISKGLLKCTE